MNDTELDDALEKLSKQVGQFTTTSTTSNSNVKGFFNNIKLNSRLVYYGIPVIICIILLILKPNFITIETQDENNNQIRKLSLFKLITAVVIVTAVILFIIFSKIYKH